MARALQLHSGRVTRGPQPCARGLERVRPYLTALFEPLPDDPDVPARPQLVDLLERYLGHRGLRLSEELAAELRGQPGPRLMWMVGSLIDAEPAKRQRLLEAADPELAESMLTSELDKLGSFGELGNVPPPPPSPFP